MDYKSINQSIFIEKIGANNFQYCFDGVLFNEKSKHTTIEILEIRQTGVSKRSFIKIIARYIKLDNNSRQNK